MTERSALPPAPDFPGRNEPARVFVTIHELIKNGFVKLACRKAGLPANMSRDPVLFIEGFEAEVISE